MGKNTQTWEVDVDPVLRCLEQNYRGVDVPKMNVAFFDIETSFDAVKGWSEPSDADNYITSVSVYLQWLGAMICLAIPPDTISWEEAEAMGNKVSDETKSHVVLFRSEAEMLEMFIKLLEDADAVSGWNCIGMEEYVFTHDRIIQMRNVQKGSYLGSENYVVNTFKSGSKRKNILRTVFGKTVNISDEHVVPYFIKGKGKYKNLNTLKSTLTEGTVADIKSKMETHDIFLKQPLRKNTNSDLTYAKLIEHVGVDLPACKLSISDDTVKFGGKVNSSGIDITSSIPLDLLQLLGYIFTDGHFSKYDNEFGFCGKYEDIVKSYSSIIENNFLSKSSGYRLAKDRCYYKRISKNNQFGLLSTLIYDAEWNKVLNVELLSLLSEDQFMAFLSGMIDGDGSVSDWHIEICNFENQIKALEILATWNGLVTTVSDSYIRIKWLDFLSDKLGKIKLLHPVRMSKLQQLKYYSKKNRANSRINWMYDNELEEVIVKISDIDETDEYIGMGDIETTSHYFNCNGLTVHNSEAYDIPYTVNRIIKVLGKPAAQRLCLWNQMPKAREFDRGGKSQITYDLVGKISADYMQLYKKYNYEERQSYALNSIAEIELGETKVDYDGTLDDLYKFDFEKFLRYNIQDTYLLDRLDRKLQFLDLANSIAHENCVLFQNTMGAVAVTDQALLMEAHRLGMVCPNKKRSNNTANDEEVRAAGGWVASPKKGLHEWIGSVDLNSLYPSTIRALNMSPETIVGQVRLDRTNGEIDTYISAAKKNSFAGWWNDRYHVLEMEDFFEQSIEPSINLDMENGESYQISGKELHQLIFDCGNPWHISANGTIFRHDVEGLIPSLLSRWYKERKALQKLSGAIDMINGGVEVPDRVKQMFG